MTTTLIYEYCDHSNRPGPGRRTVTTEEASRLPLTHARLSARAADGAVPIWALETEDGFFRVCRDLGRGKTEHVTYPSAPEAVADFLRQVRDGRTWNPEEYSPSQIAAGFLPGDRVEAPLGRHPFHGDANRAQAHYRDLRAALARRGIDWQ